LGVWDDEDMDNTHLCGFFLLFLGATTVEERSLVVGGGHLIFFFGIVKVK
jgi:hypothetical protein